MDKHLQHILSVLRMFKCSLIDLSIDIYIYTTAVVSTVIYKQEPMAMLL